MDDLTRLSLGNNVREAKSVEPLRKPQSVDGERRQYRERKAAVQKAKPEREASSLEASKKQIEQAVSEANSRLSSLNTSLHFQVHKQTKRVMVRLINEQTGETIREFPPKELLDTAAKLKEVFDAVNASKAAGNGLASGILVNEKA